jgi:hypothetical protein
MFLSAKSGLINQSINQQNNSAFIQAYTAHAIKRDPVGDRPQHFLHAGIAA